ncbi:ORF6N domain-containing protein [Paenibacillus sp. M1]|uniref:ORF6N domain-containing protein n=1 Tax=Paenibacillus haidiansis TaxID=1574488 RepID=A0ABU7VST7_9BACL
MNQLQIINHNGQRVLTTTQLAESYGTEVQILTNNFNRNKARYTEGKHYIALEGQEKRDFLNLHQNDLGSKNAVVLYLWTEKGAWMHAKSLNTDQAWEAYEMLVDDYYRVKSTLPQMSPAEVLAGVANQLVEQERRLVAVESRLEQAEKQQDDIKDILALNPTDARKKVNQLLNKIAQSAGGVGSYQDVRTESYKKLEERARCDLAKRVTNKKSRLALEGMAKSKIDKINNLDVIFEDGRLAEIYFAIVKEMAVANRIEVDAS